MNNPILIVEFVVFVTSVKYVKQADVFDMQHYEKKSE